MEPKEKLQKALQHYAGNRGWDKRDFHLKREKRGHDDGAHEVANPAFGDIEKSISAQMDVIYEGKGGMVSYKQIGKELAREGATAASFTNALGRAGYVTGQPDDRYRGGTKPGGTTLPGEWRRAMRVTISSLENLSDEYSKETRAWASKYAQELRTKLRGN